MLPWLINVFLYDACLHDPQVQRQPIHNEQWTSPTSRFNLCRWPQEEALSFITDPHCYHNVSPFSSFRPRLFHMPLRAVKAWAVDLRLWTTSHCPPARELSRRLQPKSRRMPQPPQQTRSCFSELQFPPARKFNSKTSTRTLLLWVTRWLTAGLRKNLWRILHLAAHFMKS